MTGESKRIAWLDVVECSPLHATVGLPARVRIVCTTTNQHDLPAKWRYRWPTSAEATELISFQLLADSEAAGDSKTAATVAAAACTSDKAMFNVDITFASTH